MTTAVASGSITPAAVETPEGIPPVKVDQQVLEKTIRSLMDEQQAEREAKFNKLTKDLAQVKKETEQLAQKSEELQAKIKQVKKKEKAKQKAVRKKATSKALPRYTLVGAINGQAVIKTRNGRTVNVSAGENLIGYGQVLRIDARGCMFTEKGILRTSTATCVDR